MEKAEQQRTQRVIKRSAHTIAAIDNEIAGLTKAQDCVSPSSPEYYLLAQAKGALSDAASHLGIIIRRLKSRDN